MKRVLHRVLCWALALAIAALPALAAAMAVEDGLGGHAMHASHAKVEADPSADHRTGHHGHGASHDHRSRDGHAGHADSPHGSDAHGPSSERKHASEPAVHAHCAAGDCLSTCSACSHCQGMPVLTGMNIPTPDSQTVSLHTFRNSPPAAALFRPPILS